MSIVRRTALLLAVLAVAAADVLIYMNARLCGQADRVATDEQKIDLFERADRLYPWNDVVHYGLAKAYLNDGMESLDSPEDAGASFRKAREYLRSSLRLNPTSPFGHFYLAQALLHLSLLSGSSERAYLEEYGKAGELAGPSTEVYFEVGRAGLSLWKDLSDEERSATLERVKRILEAKNKARIAALMNAWTVNVGSFESFAVLLPRDPEIYRLSARYLGEMGVSLEQRHKYLAEAEALEFDEAKRAYLSGQHRALSLHWKDAQRDFSSCLNTLKKINFYQRLVSQDLIDVSAYAELRRSALLYLIKCRVRQGEKWSALDDDLREYLGAEDRAAPLREFEAYLVERGLIGVRLTGTLDDLAALSFQLDLFCKQDRYGEILDAGRLLKNSFVIVPEGKKADYVRVLRVIGDSLHKMNRLYEADDMYRQALELDPLNLETLVRMRRNYATLNNDLQVHEVNLKIAELVSGEVNLQKYSVRKGGGFSQPLILDGEKMMLEFSLVEDSEIDPVLSVFFNDRVVWERAIAGETVSIPVKSKVGLNIVRVFSLNRPAKFLKLICRYGDGGTA